MRCYVHAATAWVTDHGWHRSLQINVNELFDRSITGARTANINHNTPVPAYDWSCYQSKCKSHDPDYYKVLASEQESRETLPKA